MITTVSTVRQDSAGHDAGLALPGPDLCGARCNLCNLRVAEGVELRQQQGQLELQQALPLPRIQRTHKYRGIKIIVHAHIGMRQAN